MFFKVSVLKRSNVTVFEKCASGTVFENMWGTLYHIINMSQNILGAHNNINHKIYTKYARALTNMMKRPNTEAKETQYRGKRDLIQR